MSKAIIIFVARPSGNNFRALTYWQAENMVGRIWYDAVLFLTHFIFCIGVAERHHYEW